MSRGMAIGLAAVFTALSLGVPQSAHARPGLYVGLGIGPSTGSGGSVSSTNLSTRSDGSSPPSMGSVPWSTSIDGSTSALFLLGYNIMGYAALETMMTGQATQLGDADSRVWAAHWHSGVRVYPMWAWQSRVPEWLQPLEPSLFAGWGLSYQGYRAPQDFEDVGWRDVGSIRLGAGFDYYVLSYLKLAVNYYYVRAAYDTFIFDMHDNDTYSVQDPATSGFHQVYLTASFHLGLAGGNSN